MRHCCQFKADDIYYLKETALYPTRTLSVGFCPICDKPIAELHQRSFTGAAERKYYIGPAASQAVFKYKDEILYSVREMNNLKQKSKPYGWKYGVNKTVKIKGEERVRQYAHDFYGNKEIVKTV